MLTRFLHIPTPPGSAQSGALFSSHRNVPSGHSGVSHGLFYDQATLWLDLQNAHAPGSLRSPSVCAPKCSFGTFRCSGRLIFRFRTDPPSVRRCSARLIRQAETLELQPLRGLHQAIPYSFLQNARPPAASRPPVGGGSFAPPLLRTDPPSVRRCSAGLIGFAKRSGFRLASLALRWAGEASLPPAPLSPTTRALRDGRTPS